MGAETGSITFSNKMFAGIVFFYNPHLLIQFSKRKIHLL